MFPCLLHRTVRAAFEGMLSCCCPFSAIAAALARQEAILAQLHEDLNSGKAEDVRRARRLLEAACYFSRIRLCRLFGSWAIASFADDF